jgi:hypothetical protein
MKAKTNPGCGIGIYSRNLFKTGKTYLSSGFPESLGPLGLPGVLLLLEISVALRSAHNRKINIITNPFSLHMSCTVNNTFEAGWRIRICINLTLRD